MEEESTAYVKASNKPHFLMLSYLRSIFISIDCLGQPISMTHKGRSTYKTLVGSIVTILLFIALMTYSVRVIDDVM